MQKEYFLYRFLTSERCRLRLFGPDARRFLHGMVSNDILALLPGQGCHATLLTVKGKLLADLVVYECGGYGLVIELVASAGAAVLQALSRHLIMDDATVGDISADIAELGVYGPGAASALGTAKFVSELGAAAKSDASAAALLALPPYHFRQRSPLSSAAAEDLPLLLSATPELGMPGFHGFGTPAELTTLSNQLQALGGKLLDDATQEILRVEAGTPLYGVDLDEDRMPAEAGLDDAVSYTKGCYLGQEVVVRLRDRGHLNRKLCGLRILDGGPAPARGTRLGHPERPNAGVVTSAVLSPRYGTIALGFVHRTAWDAGTTLELLGEDEKPLGRAAQVVTLPFRGKDQPI